MTEDHEIMPGADQVKVKTAISYIVQRGKLWIKTLSLINKMYCIGLYNLDAKDVTQVSWFKLNILCLLELTKLQFLNLTNIWTADSFNHNIQTGYRKGACEYSKRRYREGLRFIFWGQCLPWGIMPPNRARKLSALR